MEARAASSQGGYERFASRSLANKNSLQEPRGTGVTQAAILAPRVRVRWPVSAHFIQHHRLCLLGFVKRQKRNGHLSGAIKKVPRASRI